MTAAKRVWLTVAAVVVIIGCLGLLSALSPTLNIPIISETTCSIKDESWFGEPDALYGVKRAGCYHVR